jgi:hypothetical protein
MSNMENGLLTGYFGQPQNFQPNYGLSNAGLQMAQMPAGRGGVAASYDIGQQNLGLFQNAVGQFLNSQGVYSPTQEKERALQAILGGINPQDANSLADASRKLMGMGLSAEAAKLMEQAQQVAKNTAEVGKLNAEAGKASAWEGVEDRKMGLKSQTDLEIASNKLKQEDAIDRAKLQLEGIRTQAQATGDYASANLAQARIRDLELRRAAEAAKELGADVSKFTPKTLEVIAPYSKAIKPTASVVSVGNEVLDLMGLDDKQMARFVQQPAEFAKTWLSNENNVTRLRNAKSRFSNAQVVKLLGELSGSSSNEELKRFSEGLNNGYTNDEVFLRDMVMALNSAKTELDHYQGITDFAEQNAGNPLKVQNEIAKREKARLERTTKRAEGSEQQQTTQLPQGWSVREK